jgi:tRNA (guanine-N7-)-methyltransferase
VIERDVTNVLKAIEDKKYFDMQTVFGNSNPVEMDVGCGKGGFIVELAKRNPNKNYLAVEMMENIILLAGERAMQENLTNLKFINTGAEYLPRYIRPETLSAIYLNFSPPYPQNSYSNRRLSNPRFLSVYDGLLKSDGVLYQKTQATTQRNSDYQPYTRTDGC